ncbi:MAG TPA: flagellar hook-associated protein FlgK [Burkholderiaceae bacterium]|nr:flagellar hook-associated protein FlgK [Burkholderiaceae bacterium]HMX09708.1 flagellar hook-associated protein FlgK [Burkholderiaceae bacterium]HMY99737.1 flagellar hook-associated protein FlgK [Burkholderiaceae bacterium]HNB44518.1 flagellar hook-associated protein FlgK [Burkholderiaceae bacterium]HNG78239.1 flagellar hook-associated protein FlgK [Burkholderiaceae bacterium]
MNPTSLLNLGASGMMAAQAQLSTTGHNIANASVEGYSRQTVRAETAAGLYSGSGYFGRGVDVRTVERQVSSFLTDQVAQTGSQAQADSVRKKMLGQLESSFGTGQQGLGYAATQLFNAFGDVAAEPADASARRVVLERSDDLASMFRSTAKSLDSLQSGVAQDLKNSVAEVNNLAKRIGDLNGQIAATRGSGQKPNDLLDARDQLVKELSGYVQVNRVEQDDGSLNLFVGGSQSLVVGTDAYQFKATPDPTDTSQMRITLEADGISRQLDADALGGGRLAGLLQFQDDDLASARSQLDAMAEGIASAVNGQQAAGWSLKQDAAGQPLAGVALFATGTNGAADLKLAAGLTTDDIAASAQGASITSPRSNNVNALKFQQLGDAAMVGGATFTDYFSQVVADVGVRVQTANSRADVSAKLASDAQQQLGSETGVNLDEEAANLIHYQQSYQAAAKVLQVAQKVFDTLISIGGG